MKFTTLAAFAAGAIVMQRYLQQQSGARAAPLQAFEGQGDDGSMQADMGMPSEGAQSPNAAERLVDGGLAGSTQEADLFGSNSQRGEEPITPGLPDLMRGA